MPNHIKEKAIQKQREFISQLREFGTETARENAVASLNKMIDDAKHNDEITEDNIHFYYKFMTDQDMLSYQNDFFSTVKGNCEINEIPSQACMLVENGVIQTKEEITTLYARLKEYEKSSQRSSCWLGTIRLKELLIKQPNTPIEVIEDISAGVLKKSYLFEYYGGYAGDDYRVTINLTNCVKERLERENKEFCQNLQKYIIEEEIERIIEQIEITDVYEEGGPENYNELNNKLTSLKQQYQNIVSQNDKYAASDVENASIISQFNIPDYARQAVIEKLVERDIASIKESLSHGDTEFLSNVLSGDGFKPYSQLSNGALVKEFENEFEQKIEDFVKSMTIPTETIAEFNSEYNEQTSNQTIK